MSSEPLDRRPIIVIACLSMVVFGIVLTTLGATLPAIIESFGIDKRAAGGLLSLISFAVLAGSLVFGPIVDRRGYRALLVFSFAAIIAGLELIAFAPSIGWLRAGVLLIGFTGALVNGAANALIVDVSRGKRTAALAFMSAFFGVGAAGVPITLALLAGAAPGSLILGGIGLLVAVPLVLTARATFPPEKQPHGVPLARARSLAGDRILLLFGLILFLESGLETTVGGWTASYFAEELNVSVTRAPIYLGVFWLGLMFARLAIGTVLRDATRLTLLFGGATVALVSALALVATRDLTIAGIAVFGLGAGFAPVFPVIFGVVGDRYEELSGTALSLVIGIALVGGMVMPYVVGLLAGEHGLRASFFLVPAAILALVILVGTMARHLARPEHAT